MAMYRCEVETKDYGYGSRFKDVMVEASSEREAWAMAMKCSGVEVVMSAKKMEEQA